MFTSVFGETPHVRVLDFLASHREFDYTITEIARNSGVARPTVYKIVEEYLAKGILRATREVGASTFYKLNAENSAVRTLLAVDPAAFATTDMRPSTRAAPARRRSRP